MMDSTFKHTGEELFMKTNIRNITFDGIESILLTMMEGTPMEGAIQMPFDKFGWFYGVSECIITVKGVPQGVPEIMKIWGFPHLIFTLMNKLDGFITN